jgi:hypothetical protein
VAGARYAGSSLSTRIPFVSRAKKPEEVDTPAAWDLSMFTTACADVAGNRELDARSKALVNRLLVEADGQGFPLPILTDPVETMAKMDWRKRYAMGLTEVLDQVEKQWTRPTGFRRVIQTTLVIAADWLPPLALIAALINLLWRIFDVDGRGHEVGWLHVALPAIVLLVVLVLLHLLIYLLLPLRWDDIRDVFHKKLEERVRQELESVYLNVPTDVADQLEEERRRVNKLIDDTREVASWLEQREQSASVAGLYGH